MLSFESVKQRLERESPLSFLEFNYMLLQAYDFVELSRCGRPSGLAGASHSLHRRRLGVTLQMGGSDQWGNIVNGVELGRKVLGTQLFGVTAPLITTSDGRKMGKSASGAIWLNADKLSPFDYWQFWRNTTDADVVRCVLQTTMGMKEAMRQCRATRYQSKYKCSIFLSNAGTSFNGQWPGAIYSLVFFCFRASDHWNG
jgi:tyrosyl-tRNA synthetase